MPAIRQLAKILRLRRHPAASLLRKWNARPARRIAREA
jgi:hypothetical protein